MRTVYVETTIPSFYHTGRKSPQAIAWRTATRRWWDHHRAHFELCTSEVTSAELARSPSEHLLPRLRMLDDLRMLDITPRVQEIAAAYIAHTLMPASADADALHVAAASHYSIDFLLTWNCTHIVNPNKARHLRTINDRLGVRTPIMVTPYTLLPEVDR